VPPVQQNKNRRARGPVLVADPLPSKSETLGLIVIPQKQINRQYNYHVSQRFIGLSTPFTPLFTTAEN
jgi:hypothetical protein